MPRQRDDIPPPFLISHDPNNLAHGVTALTTPLTVYLLPPALVRRVEPLFAAQTYDQPFRESVFDGTLTAPVVADHPTEPTAAVVGHPFYYFLAGPVTPALRAFLVDAPEESGVFTHYYAYAAESREWPDALAAERDFMILDRCDYKWPDGQPAPDWRPALPDGATLARIDGAMAARVDRELDEHISANWGDYETFDRHGDGLALLMDGRVACAAYTSGMSRTQANVSIVTAPELRGRGLATLTCAALIEQLIARGVQPTWCSDAINTGSRRLAQKLGFVEDKPYFQVGPHWGQTMALSRGRWTAGAPLGDGVVPWSRVEG